MATIEIEINDDSKVSFIKQLLIEFGLLEIESNVFTDNSNEIEIANEIQNVEN